jgi:hypothetical protein
MEEFSMCLSGMVQHQVCQQVFVQCAALVKEDRHRDPDAPRRLHPHIDEHDWAAEGRRGGA